ncbi:MAG: hypothetical protein KA004_12865 [Verrucomicrobiales bacterium]|nr:hypothetical protein [Verrucomicrobiales bacterium]
MHRPDDIQFAFEETTTLHEPDRRLETFGTTSFEFHLLTELMDDVTQTRIRSGRIHAERPVIFRPDAPPDFAFEGFDAEQAAAFSHFLEQIAGQTVFLQYGFSFRKSDVTESLVHETLETVQDRVIREVRDNPHAAVLRGVDDAWEICLLKFTLEMVQKSHGINIFDLKRRGLI